jgi:hypothetical protein
MGETVHFRAGGTALQIIKDWQAASLAYREHMVAIQKRLGATGMFTYSDGRFAGFAFNEDVELPKHLRRVKDNKECVVPNGRYKDGQALTRELGEDQPMGQMALTSKLVGGPKVTGAARGGGMYMGMVSFETIGDEVIIGVPLMPDGEPMGIPDDSPQLKMSEYWALKEAAA